MDGYDLMKYKFSEEKNIMRDVFIITEWFLFYDFVNVMISAIFLSTSKNDIQRCIFQQPPSVIMHEFTG